MTTEAKWLKLNDLYAQARHYIADLHDRISELETRGNTIMRWEWRLPDQPGHWVNEWHDSYEVWWDEECQEYVIGKQDDEAEPVSDMVKRWWLMLPPVPPPPD